MEHLFQQASDSFIFQLPDMVSVTEFLIKKLQVLPPEQQQQVLDFVEFLVQKYAQTQMDENPPKQPRILGLHEGMGWMSEDFNELLPDEFWLGESCISY